MADQDDAALDSIDFPLHLFHVRFHGDLRDGSPVQAVSRKVEADHLCSGLFENLASLQKRPRTVPSSVNQHEGFHLTILIQESAFSAGVVVGSRLRNGSGKIVTEGSRFGPVFVPTGVLVKVGMKIVSESQ